LRHGGRSEGLLNERIPGEQQLREKRGKLVEQKDFNGGANQRAEWKQLEESNEKIGLRARTRYFISSFHEGRTKVRGFHGARAGTNRRLAISMTSPGEEFRVTRKAVGPKRTKGLRTRGSSKKTRKVLAESDGKGPGTGRLKGGRQ